MWLTDRIDPNFDDLNAEVLTKVITVIPEAKTMEMESFLLLHLAKCAKDPIRACACAIVVSNWKDGWMGGWVGCTYVGGYVFLSFLLAMGDGIALTPCASLSVQVANRATGRVVDEESFSALELSGGRAVLNALTKLAL